MFKTTCNILSRSISTLDLQSPTVLPETATLSEVISALSVSKTGAALITCCKNKIQAITSERDVIRYLAKNSDVDMRALALETVVTRNVYTVSTSDTIGHCFQVMAHGGFRHIPVVTKDNNPVLIVSVQDLITFIVNDMDAKIESVMGGITPLDLN